MDIVPHFTKSGTPDNSGSSTGNHSSLPNFKEHTSVPLTVDEVQTNIVEFSNQFNSLHRLVLLNCKAEERGNVKHLLIRLKKSITMALEELGNGHAYNSYHFRCGLCDEDITVNPKEDFWCSLQDHEHFEDLYYRFLKGDLELQATTDDLNKGQSTFDSTMKDTVNAAYSNPDSGSIQQDVEAPQVNSSPVDNSTDDVNTFRFNFNISYDKEIEDKIFPSGMMQAVRRYDKVKDFTMMRVGGARAACLICNCELNSVRIGKHTLVNHALGQRHLKSANDSCILDTLQSFHDFWLRQEKLFQAHQVYFRPYESSRMKCTICAASFCASDVISHILNKDHRRIVMEIYDRRINLYYLINLQVQVYGVPIQDIEAREAELKRLEETRASRRSKNSESDTTDDQRKNGVKPVAPVTHHIIKSVEKTESDDAIELLPNRMKECAAQLLKMTTAEGTSIYCCKLCNIKLINDVEALKNHLVSTPKHKMPQLSYYCEICDIHLKSESLWMKHDFTANRHKRMPFSRKSKVAEYECTACKLVIYGDDISLTRHLSLGNTRTRRERGNKLTDAVKTLLQSKSYVLSQAGLLAGNAELVLKNRLTQDCCTRLEAALTETFADCKVYPFGSRVSGIGTLDSDLDVFVDVGDTYYGQKKQDPAEQVVLLRDAFKVFNKHRDYSRIVKVSTARTPILKLYHQPTKLACDLSFKHGLSVENTKFIRLCIELQPVVQELILLVKKWAEYIAFENITTYAFAMMCIFYLQVNGYLPSVQTIRTINGDTHPSITGWKIINYTLSRDEMKTHVAQYKGTVYELLQDFFKYYSKFDFNTNVVCPLLGEVVKRSQFDDLTSLPEEMSAYVDQLEGDDPEIFRYTSFMCVQDPFDLSHNLTKAVQQGTVNKFQTLCKLSEGYIEGHK